MFKKLQANNEAEVKSPDKKPAKPEEGK